MKILMTGATASQTPNYKNENTTTFAKLVYSALIHAKHNVTWIDPSVSLTEDYLAEFDSVLVGIAPPTSTAAHRIYGALSIIYNAHRVGNLTIMIDAPEPKRVWAGLRAIYNKPEDLTKDFYSKRQEYKKVLNESALERLHGAVSFLYKNEWPTTIYPAFPWMSFPSLSSVIPNTNYKNLIGLNYDEKLLTGERINTPENSAKEKYWVVDSANTQWVRGIEKTLNNKVVPARQNRWEKNYFILQRMSSAVGCLVSVYEDGNPWWSVSLSQSLSQGTPVATDWKLSSMLGEDWSMLPHSIEDLSEYDRKVLAEIQRISYLQTVPSWEKSVELTSNALLRK